MNFALAVFNENGIDLHAGMRCALRYYDIPHRDRAEVTAIFEMARREGIGSNLIKCAARTLPWCEGRRRVCGQGPRKCFFSLVNVGAVQNRIVRNLFDDADDLGFGNGQIEDVARRLNIIIVSVKGNGHCESVHGQARKKQERPRMTRMADRSISTSSLHLRLQASLPFCRNRHIFPKEMKRY